MCDGVPNCPAGQDEWRCPSTDLSQISVELFKCDKSGQKIAMNLVNDLYPDCPDGEDEIFLSTGLATRYDSLIQCPNKEFSCLPGHSRCFSWTQMCQYDLDKNGHLRYCRNGAHLATCEAIGCPSRFKCSNAYCVPLSRVCNSVWDCPGGEDEGTHLCANVSGSCPGLFKCKNGRCLDLDELCDGFEDCGDSGEDERFCQLARCPEGCLCHGLTINCPNYDTPVFPRELYFNVSGYRQMYLKSSSPFIPLLDMGFELAVLSLEGFTTNILLQHSFLNVSQLLHLNISFCKQLREIRGFAFQELVNLQSLSLHDHSKTASSI